MKRLVAIFTSVSALTILANAATRTAASASYADVSAAVVAAARGDTVVVPAGSSSWGSTLTLTKGINLQGAGRDGTVLTRGGVIIAIVPDATAVANDEVIRVEGFTFDGNDVALNMITVNGTGPNANKAFKNLAIGKNRFRNSGVVTSGCGAISLYGQTRGLIYSNIFDRCNVIIKNMGNDSTAEWASGYFPFAYGTADNLFFEGNTIQYSSAFSGQDPGWTETGQGARMVCRYNTWNLANTKQNELWDIHGFQNWPGGQTGTMISEYYGNTALNCTGYRWINHRGSWGLYFNNIVSGSGGMGINANQYVGCTSMVPGASGVYNPEITNTYCFNNTMNGTIRNMGLGDGSNCGVAENRNWWNYNASFNGTAGIGRGTAAPTGNCSVGVAYWVASTATPTTDPRVIQSGTLYKCLSPNVWTAYYRPYTFPHPLQAGAVTASTISVSPGSLNFGTVEVGSTNDMTVSVQNIGGGTIAGTASVAAPFSIVGNASYSLSGGQAQTITIRYNPTVAGTANQTVTFTGGGGASVQATGSARTLQVAVPGQSFDATLGTVSTPFMVNPDNTFSQTVETIDPMQGGEAIFLLNIANSGNYIVSADVYAPSDSANSLFVNFDTEPTSPDMIWDIPVNTGLTKNLVTWRLSSGANQVWSLSAGTHRLIIRGREAGVKVGSITVSALAVPAAPKNLRVVAAGN